MIGTGLTVRQIVRHIRREKWLSLGSFLVLLILLLLVDMFWIASVSFRTRYRQTLSTVTLEAFLSGSVGDDRLPAIEQALRTMPDVGSFEFVSKEEAARILENNLGAGIMDVLEENPLPRSYILHFNRVMSLDALDNAARTVRQIQGVETVEFGRSWIEKLERIKDSIHQATYPVGGLILFVVLLTVANTNRLSARSKARDFFQLKLLGAGPSYLVAPYLAEGFLGGLMAALIGWLGLVYLAGKLTLSMAPISLPAGGEITLYILAAGITGMVGAYVGIRRFLMA